MTTKYDHEISLNAVLRGGRTVTDVFGYVSNEFGEPVFKITRIALSDGAINAEGEHDMPYLTDDHGFMDLPEDEGT